MKPLIALFLILGTALATQAFGEDATPQPLTRADCEAAPDRSWSETPTFAKAVPRVRCTQTPASCAKRLRAGRHVVERQRARLR